MMHANFEKAISFTMNCFRTGAADVHTEKWQSIDISSKPEAAMKELTNVSFEIAAPFRDGTDLDVYRDQIQPNLPWADRHFELERVSGAPINPGTTWKEWPYANSADKFRKNELFSHTYAERYWPKLVNYNPASELDCFPMAGIRYAYGDLNDMVELLLREPLTRQAYLPVWFPEDTGVVHGERVPCTLGYHLMMRNGRLNMSYFIRSCDLARHFRDDLYLTVRLQLWILDRLKNLSSGWADVEPGNFFFWCGSMHCFVNDYRKLFK